MCATSNAIAVGCPVIIIELDSHSTFSRQARRGGGVLLFNKA